MIIERMEKRYWRMRCHVCHTVLLLDENDFMEREFYGCKCLYVSTPCPVCGKIWDNVEQASLGTVYHEIK